MTETTGNLSVDFENFVSILRNSKTIAVVGATNNKDKYGYKIVNELLQAGYNVVPINPKYKEVVGIRAFASISDAIEHGFKPEVIVFVVPPVVSKKVLRKLKDTQEFSTRLVWFQPGSYDNSTLEYAKQYGIHYAEGFCILKDFLFRV